MKVIFAAYDPQPQRWTNLIAEQLPDAEIIVWEPGMAPTGADYALVWQPAEALFEAERQLKAVFNLGAGIDGLLRLRNLPPELPVVRLEDAGMSVQMAEYVAYHVIGASRDMDLYRNQQADNQWKIHRPIKRSEWPVGVLGLGHIGKRVAQTLAGLEYPVHGWARTAHDIEGVRCHAGQAELDTFLQSTRVLINTLPLTDETRDLIDYRLLGRLRPGAMLINVGRGEHLVDEDLIRALAEGHVTRAVLDVFRQEPLPGEHPFWRTPGLTITPHISARTLRDATVEQICGKIRALEAGQQVSGVVDLGRGY